MIPTLFQAIITPQLPYQITVIDSVAMVTNSIVYCMIIDTSKGSGEEIGGEGAALLTNHVWTA